MGTGKGSGKGGKRIGAGRKRFGIERRVVVAGRVLPSTRSWIARHARDVECSIGQWLDTMVARYDSITAMGGVDEEEPEAYRM